MTDLLGGVTGGVGGLLGGVGALAGPTAGDVVSHLAQPGDTLASIADAHGVPLSTVVDANPGLAHLSETPPGTQVSVPLAGANEAAHLGDAAGRTGLGSASPAPGSSFAQSAASGGPSGAPSSFGGAPGAPGALGQPAGGVASGPGAEPGGPPSTATSFAGAAEWRVLAQAAPPPLRAAAAADAPDPLSALFALALETGGGRLPPELQASSTGRLAQALELLGWSPVAATAGRPGDVVILMLPDGLHAVRLGADGLAGAPLSAAPPAAGAEADAVLVRPPGPPPGVDVASPQARAARAGEREARAKAGARDGGREPAESPQRAWITRVLPAAKQVKARWAVPAGATVAHGALASDWGRIAPGNDFFGLLSARAAGTSITPVRTPGQALVAAAYPSLEDAAQDYGAALRGDARLAPAFRHRDAAGFARALARGGFGGPRYAERMDALIGLNDLAALD